MRLRFTIGPVQELVRQSRRTRDLWASSFLLSYLSGCAMAGARAHGSILVPKVDQDPLFMLICSGGEGQTTDIGSLPNRFELETDDPEAAAAAARQSLGAAWKQIYEAVWSQYLVGPATQGCGTDAIYRRQVEDFWEIQWVSAPDDEAMRGLLERRKSWRSRVPTIEPGDKCVVMPELQELSGYVRARSTEEREKQEDFWAALRSHGNLHTAELRPNERLSGVSLVKRLYPRREVSEQAIGWAPGTVRWRSTVYVAAIPWIDEVLERNPEGCRQYAEQVCALDQRARREIPDRSVRSRSNRGGNFARLDANYFFSDALDNPDATLQDVRPDAGQRDQLKQGIKALYGVGSDDPVGPPASYYALLLMDGDRVGELLARFGGDSVGRSLAIFTHDVPEIVERHQGYTVYAGGDDVLAMLPVPSALACAWELRRRYESSFSDGRLASATTSAAVVFAHMRQPLRQVLEEAHRLLDEVAKDRNGRSSVAISVLKRGHRALEWVTTWDLPGEGGPRLEALSSLVGMWRARSTRRRSENVASLLPGEISAGLVYRLRDLMGLLCGWPRWEPGIYQPFFGGDPVKLLAAEIRRATRAAGLEEEIERDADEGERQREAERMALKLMGVSHPAVRDENGGLHLLEDHLGMDGPLLALFLAQDGKEHDHGAMEATQ